jgi:hypothetical protein
VTKGVATISAAYLDQERKDLPVGRNDCFLITALAAGTNSVAVGFRAGVNRGAKGLRDDGDWQIPHWQ